MLGVCSIMGLPWFVAATVLSISHVNSLKVESGCSAPGEQPKFLGIREQRVTGFMIFMLMGCSVFMTSVLKVRWDDHWNHIKSQTICVTSNIRHASHIFSYVLMYPKATCVILALPFMHCKVNNSRCLTSASASSVHPYARPVWSLPLHGCLFPQGHSSKTLLWPTLKIISSFIKSITAVMSC